MSTNPAKLYNLNIGFIEEGAVADIVIFNPEEEWTVESFVSKADNSPFKGKSLYGKVNYTICNGRLYITPNLRLFLKAESTMLESKRLYIRRMRLINSN